MPHLERQAYCPSISFIGHDLHYLRTRREYEVNGDEAVLKESGKWREREKAVIEAVDHTLYFSQVEVGAVAELVPDANVRTIPVYILEPMDLERTQTCTTEILFVARFSHPPNIDGAIWYVTEILPLIREQVGDVHFNIAGSNPTKSVLDLASDDFMVHGYVSDERLRERYAKAACAVVPLRFGARVKEKVLDAIQYGVPLVTTGVGAEGILDADKVLDICDTSGFFAEAVASAMERTQGTYALRGTWLDENFSVELAIKILRSLTED